MEISSLREEHDRSDFRSGEPALDNFLRQYAGVNEGKISRTYVATEESDPTILGYVTILAGAVACEYLPEDQRRSLPRYPVPVLHIGRLAADVRTQGKRLGETLLMHALKKALDLADEIGLLGVEVFAKTDNARKFYERYGLCSLSDTDLYMYVSLEIVRGAFE